MSGSGAVFERYDAAPSDAKLLCDVEGVVRTDEAGSLGARDTADDEECDERDDDRVNAGVAGLAMTVGECERLPSDSVCAPVLTASTCLLFCTVVPVDGSAFAALINALSRYLRVIQCCICELRAS